MAGENMLHDWLMADQNKEVSAILLKKIIATVSLGWLRINSLPPDKAYSLEDYLFDNEHLILDFSHLSEQSKTNFKNWLLDDCLDDAHKEYFYPIKTNEYRGYTAESKLSWWQRLFNFLFLHKPVYQWPLNKSVKQGMVDNLNMLLDKKGLLLGFDGHNLSEEMGVKYQEQRDVPYKLMGNTKKVTINEQLVNQLTHINLDTLDFNEILSNPHPYSITVEPEQTRYSMMQDFQRDEQLCMTISWYQRLWQWFIAFWSKEDDICLQEIHSKENFETLIEIEDAIVKERKDTGEILVIEQKPNIDSVVFCGGGSKIYGHVGAMQAFEEANIRPTHYAGSSAGAIMALLCYLGYSTPEIYKYFQSFREENLLHYEIDFRGLSGTEALKAGIDFMIIKKVNELIARYELDKTWEGRKFLQEKVFHHGKITFGSLKALKTRLPACELGEELVITSTKIKARKTTYFSSATPDIEVSDVVRKSASFPIVFKPTAMEGDNEGEFYSDGGILNNIPIEAFHCNDVTFLTAEQGNCMRLVAIQFDNGPEGNVLEKFVDRVYQENFMWNWLYSFLTGIRNVVSNWVLDRLKLRQYSNQVILIPIDDISATQFDLDKKKQESLIKNGYECAMNYLKVRYDIGKEGGNKEAIYARFNNLEEAIYFSCFRQREDWFLILSKLALQKGITKEHLDHLRTAYFRKVQFNKDLHKKVDTVHSATSFSSLSHLSKTTTQNDMKLFEALYPIFLKLPLAAMVSNKSDLKCLKKIRHQLSIYDLQQWINSLDQVKQDTHIVFAILKNVLQHYKKYGHEELCRHLDNLASILEKFTLDDENKIYGQWSLNMRQIDRLIKIINDKKWQVARGICASLQYNAEPMQIFVKDKSGKISIAENEEFDNLDAINFL